jgi:protein-S-isoprenylcysteine O-methyltransferase Ste14
MFFAPQKERMSDEKLFNVEDVLNSMEIKEREWFSSYVIGIAVVLLILVSLYDFVYIRGIQTNLIFFIGGLLLLISGFVLRQICKRELGKHMSMTIKILKKHKVVSTGPYRLLRHPMYTGALMYGLGIVMISSSVLGAAFLILVYTPVWVYRINLEEDMLVNSLGMDYVHYRKKTYRLIPYVW